MKKSASFFLVFSVLVTFLASSNHAEVSVSIKASKALINQICKTTINPSFCLKVLNSNPRTPGASLKDLARISIDLSESHAKAARKLIGSLSEKITDPRLKDVYQTCLENYDQSISSLDDGRKDLISGNINGLNTDVSAASTGADTCEDGFVEASFPEPPQIKHANKELGDLCSIILAISTRL